uniref:THIF-type NAD/FAD binding fold domain-containing protein n=1 Tax=Hyaloperonospora arabidopsidis (strain Emoy2) TaxID=559515 RepID=M4B175_HYAAE
MRQLGAAFGVGVAAAIAAQYMYQVVLKHRRHTFHCTSMSVPTVLSATDAAAQELLAEQMSRVASFFGSEGFDNVKNAFVVVVGLGGVGSHAAHMLARSGIGKLRLVDFDNVTLSSLNRHAVATRADVGLSKVTVMKRHLLQIVPDCDVEEMAVMFEAESAEELLEGGRVKTLQRVASVNDVKRLIGVC